MKISGTVRRTLGRAAALMNGRILGIALAVMVLFAAAAPVDAGNMTYNVSFSANTFQVGSGADPAPVDPVTGSFTITFDPTLVYTNTTAGISLNTLDITLGSPLSFSYDPAAGGFPAGTLRVGGLSSGSDVITFSPSTNDFWLYINDFTGAAAFQQMGYTQTAVSSNNLFFTLNQTGSVTVTQTQPIPEPASLSLLSLGLVGMGAARRYRRRHAV